ncbi:MAG: hypothetical protein IPM39_16655 [Chloroflexi bacterium]|nr:hypothetical protein [Chloroflexota bacterium]
MGRFASADTIIPDPAQPQTFNRYTYVFNRPLVLNDPSGHCPWCIGAIGGAIGGAAVGYGAQVYQNMQNGQSFTAALTTDIDAGKIVAGAVVGAVVGGTLGAAAPALTTYGTVAVAQVQTTAVAAAAAHPTAAAAVGGLVETAVECAMTGGGCGSADYAIGALTAGVSHRLSTPGASSSPRTALTQYDPEFASRSLLGQNYPGATGYGVTPGGRTISAHAAERIALGGLGRPATNLAVVDNILDSGNQVRFDPVRNTIQVRATQLPSRPYVVVSGNDPNHIVTVMVPR